MSKVPRVSSSRGVYLRALASLRVSPSIQFTLYQTWHSFMIRTMESDAEGLKTWGRLSQEDLFIHLFIKHPFICPTYYPSIHSHIHPSTYPSTHWSTHLPICFCKLILSMNPLIVFHSFFSFSLLPSSHFLPSSYALSSSSIHTHIFTLFVYLYV